MANFLTRSKVWSRGWHANAGIATALTLGAVALSCPFIAHQGGDIAIGKALMEIHYGKFLPKQWQWVWIDLQGAALLFLIASGWLIHHRTVKKAAVRAADDPSAPGSSVTIVWENGQPEAEATARRLAQASEERGLRAFATESTRYETSRLPEERWLVCILAGADREPGTPLLRLNGEKLSRLEFAVLGADHTPSTATRCAALNAGLAERGARAFIPAGKIALASDSAWTGTIISYLARFTKDATSTGKSANRTAPAKAEPAEVAV